MVHFHSLMQELFPFGWDPKVFVFRAHIDWLKNRSRLLYSENKYLVPWKDSEGNYHAYVWINDSTDFHWIYADPHGPKWRKHYEINFICNLVTMSLDDDTEEIELMSPEEWAQLMKYGPGYYSKYGKKCECGSEKVYGDKATHSHWCPKYESNT